MKHYCLLISVFFLCRLCVGQGDGSWEKYSPIIKKHIAADYKAMFRDSGGVLKYPFLAPGSQQYANVLWDWDSWLSNVALRQTLLEAGSENDRRNAVQYEQGCVLNYLSFSDVEGWIPVVVGTHDKDRRKVKPPYIYETNMHKPCLAQHAAFLTKLNGGNADWLKEEFYHLQTFVNNYVNHHRNLATGLYFWQNDSGIGVDNDPSTFYRPPRSSGSIYLNSLMYKELEAMVYLCNQLNLNETSPLYQKNADDLKKSIQENCWDEKDGFYYSVDLNLLPLKDERGFVLHGGMPRDWNCLIQRIGVWSGFMPMWAGIATPEQAARMVRENYADARTFNAPFGVRTLSKLEKMYNLKASGNPSLWLGPVWGVSNYLTWRGLVKYGYKNEARELAVKTVILFGRDFEKNGALHEYYQPENGEPILNKGFQNWNYLVLNMLAWLEGREVISEF